MSRSLSALLTATIALGIAGCETQSVASDAVVANVEWQAETINGKPVIEPGRVTLTIAEGRVFGGATRNRYSGAVEYGGAKIKIGPLISTKMACLGQGLMQQEQEYLSTLQTAQTYVVRGGRKLELIANSGRVLVFVAGNPPN